MATPSVLDFSFEGHPIRCVGSDRDLWFVAKDVCEALGISWRGTASLESIPASWRGIRKLRTPQANQYGQRGFTEIDVVVINEAAVYKLAFRSNKPSADAFTNWVAEEVLPSIRKTGSYTAARRARYERQGKQLEWIEQREEGIQARKGFTDALHDHGVEDRGYADCTNAIYRPVLGGTAAGVKVRMGLKPNAQLRDSLSTIELAKVKLAELLAVDRISEQNLQGNGECSQACRLSGQAVATAAEIARCGDLSLQDAD